MKETESDPWLVLQAQSGDREALEALLESVQRPLHRYVLGLTGDQSVADDVLQDTLVRIYRKLGWLDDPALFRPWAYRIASREAFRFLERRGKSQEHEVDDSALETLPGDLRTAIIVFALAEAAGLTAFVVYVLLAK